MKVPALALRTAVALVGAASLLPTACGSPDRSAGAATTAPRPVSARKAVSTTEPPATAAPLTTRRDLARDIPEASGRNVNQGSSVGVPTVLEIPSIGVRSDLLRLGLAPDGTVRVPEDPQRAGWFTGGSRPGDEGPAVILGHIDSRTGPAIFYRLRELVAGATVTIDTSSRRRVVFTVDRVEQVAKDAFPSAAVYGPAFGRQLRLITCGGSFDRSDGHYRDNVIVFLSATGKPHRT